MSETNDGTDPTDSLDEQQGDTHSGVASLPAEAFEDPAQIFAPDERETDEQDALNEVFLEYQTEIDPVLLELGWLFAPNKSVEFGKVDQSMLNHTRNLVYFLHRLATQARQAGIGEISPTELRHLIALSVVHDFHKLREVDSSREQRFDISIEELEPFVRQSGIQKFSVDPSEEGSELSMGVFRACTVDHHASDNAKSTGVPLIWEDYRPLIRLADGMASSATPEEATDSRNRKLFEQAFPGSDVELVHHRIDQVTGSLTNLVNTAVADYLDTEFDHTLLTIYQDGCVYLAPKGRTPEPTDEMVESIYSSLRAEISSSHPAYSDTEQLADDLSASHLGLYSLSGSMFFYAGARRIVDAVIWRGLTSGSENDDPPKGALNSLETLEEKHGWEFDKTRQLYDLSVAVGTIRRKIINPFLDDQGMKTKEGIEATGRALGVPDTVAERLVALSPEDKEQRTAGSKWEFSYSFAQALLDQHGSGERLPNGEQAILSSIDAELEELAGDEDWVEVLNDEYAGGYRSEVVSFIETHLRVGSGSQREAAALSDTYDQYTKSTGRGYICSLCSGGLSEENNLGSMKAGEGETMIRGGYTNRDPIGQGKREGRIVCVPCQIELSLRGSTSQWQFPGQLFIHLAPDYFYTPATWRLYNRTINYFTGESKVRIDRLAEAVFEMETPEQFATVIDELATTEGGRPMIESQSGGLRDDAQYGTQVVSYFKELYSDTGNDTEFQFFGAFLALTISAYTGTRAYLSSSPIPEMRSRDYQEFVKIGSGFTQVTAFYGDSVPLSKVHDRLQAAASLIKLGYALQFYKFDNKPKHERRNDSLFAKYLRVNRNELLPGSYLFKRVSQAENESSDDGPYIPALMKYAVALDQ